MSKQPKEIKGTTLKEAMALLRKHGMIILKHDDEYCVNFRHGSEATSYYTSDLQDAVSTACHMAETAHMKFVGRSQKQFERQAS